MSYETEVLADSPAHYWRLGGASNTNELNEVGGAPTLLSPTPGPSATTGALVDDADGAKLFSAVSGQSSLSAAGVDLTTTDGDPLTIECWCWIDAYADDDRMLLEFNPSWFAASAGESSFNIDLGNSSGGGEANTVSVGFKTFSGAEHRGTFLRSALPTGGWHHLVIVYTPDTGITASDRLKVWVDAAPVTVTHRTATLAGDDHFTSDVLFVMARSANSLQTPGRLDELALYTHGLTQGRITAHYNAAQGTPTKLSIAEENALPGNDSSEWSIGGAGDTTNLGFCREFSLNVGETAHFACDGDGEVIDIYRIGYYGGDGWRKVATLENTPTSQPDPTTIADSNGSVTCEAWTDTASWAIPDVATPGIYMGVYRNAALNDASWIPFVVRDDDRDADIMVKTSDSTWALAYNYYGTPASPLTGKSLYGSNGPMSGGTANRGHAMTYHRPIVTRAGIPQTYPLYTEFALIRYLERMGFDVTYSACKDWREGVGAPTLATCKIYISHGHDEYWSQGMRDKWEALRDAGKHLIFMSGNEVFWRTRFETDGDVMWCFKDTMAGPGGHVAGTALDPVSWTGTWKDTRPANDATRDPEWTLTGTDFRMNGIQYRAMVIAAASPESQHEFWRHTDVEASGLTVQDVIGMEADEMNPLQPVGSRSVLASTTPNIDDFRADDNGEIYNGDGDLEWGIIAQRYPSGALVVGFGTVTWSWGLDNVHDVTTGGETTLANSQQQQAILNLLRDLGAAAPETPIGGLTLPTPVSLANYGAIPDVRRARYHVLKDGIWETIDFSPEV